jgi:hypothetical protein
LARTICLEDVERPEGEFEAVLGKLLEPGQVLGLERLADAAGQAEHGMDDLAAEVGDQLAQTRRLLMTFLPASRPTLPITPTMLRCSAGLRGRR